MVLNIHLPELKVESRVKTLTLIFDLDGTLYDFRGEDSQRASFGQSTFYAEIKERAYAFLSRKQSINESSAVELYNKIKDKWNGEVSIGVEKDLGIDRYEFFENVWNLDPSKFVDANNLRPIFSEIEKENLKVVILTASPRVWALKALKHLGLESYGNRLFTGEPDIRKPDPEAFMNVCRTLRIKPEECISIGDQVTTDIIPAKSLGMKTIFVGDSCHDADYTVKSVKNILEILRKLK